MAVRLQSRYPGVEFVGEMSPTSFIGDATISPGAKIDLSQGVHISDQSQIGRDAIIEGGSIRHSIIHGRVSRGRMEDCSVAEFARIRGGTLLRCSIRGHGQVESGTLLDTMVTDDAQFCGGQAYESEISGHARVTGGLLVRSIVKDHGLITGGQAFDSLIFKHGQLSHGKITETQIEGKFTSLNPTGFGEKLPFRQLKFSGVKPPLGTALLRLSTIASNKTRPPDVIVDQITSQLIVDAVCLPHGETYNRSTISQQTTNDALMQRCYRNQAVQQISDRWREFTAVSSLIRLKGYVYDIPFKLPPFVDPITSRSIQKAVLCPCGQTYNRSTIFQYIRQHQSCPTANHELQKEDLYPNLAIQRLIKDQYHQPV